MSGRGAQMAETLVSFLLATAGTPSTATFAVVGTVGSSVRLGDGVEHPVGS